MPPYPNDRGEAATRMGNLRLWRGRIGALIQPNQTLNSSVKAKAWLASEWLLKGLTQIGDVHVDFGKETFSVPRDCLSARRVGYFSYLSFYCCPCCISSFSSR